MKWTQSLKGFLVKYELFKIEMKKKLESPRGINFMHSYLQKFCRSPNSENIVSSCIFTLTLLAQKGKFSSLVQTIFVKKTQRSQKFIKNEF